MTLAELPHVDVGAVLYDAGTLEQPTRKNAAVDRTWIMAGNSLCDRIAAVVAAGMLEDAVRREVPIACSKAEPLPPARRRAA